MNEPIDFFEGKLRKLKAELADLEARQARGELITLDEAVTLIRAATDDLRQSRQEILDQSAGFFTPDQLSEMGDEMSARIDAVEKQLIEGLPDRTLAALDVRSDDGGDGGDPPDGDSGA